MPQRPSSRPGALPRADRAGRNNARRRRVGGVNVRTESRGLPIELSRMDERNAIVDLIPRLRRYARALVGDRSVADDLVQDTLERAWAKFHLYRGGTDLRAWLFTVMHNVHVNRVRAYRPTDALTDDMPETAQRASQGDSLMVRDLDRALAKLPQEQREVLLLVALENVSYDEAARALGIPIGTVMSRLSRARERLRTMMLDGPASAKLTVVK
jgi:RNA polymerase sigma-70 factor, ECF subfamily